MANVSLRGRSDGYELEIPAESNFAASLTDLKKLLKKVRDQDNSLQEITFSVRTGRRVLTDEQHKQITVAVTSYDKFRLTGITADVLDQPSVDDLLKAQQVFVVPQIIRSGQELFFDGDVVLLGSVHQGAMLKASKNIYVVGVVDGGVLHAGYPDHADAIIAGDVSQAAQIRISDLVAIVADNPDMTAHKFAHVNEKHELVVDPLSDLKKLKPALYTQMEGK